MTRDDFISAIELVLPDNLAGEISAFDMRNVLTVLSNSTVNTYDKVSLGQLGEDVMAALMGGLDPTKYINVWVPSTNTPTIPTASGHAGEWYICESDGTASGNAAGPWLQGEVVVSNGTSWLRQPVRPTVIPDNSITRQKLTPEIRNLMIKTDSEEFAYCVTDNLGSVGWGIRHDGTIYGLVEVQDGSVTLPKLHPEVRSLMLSDQGGDPGYFFSITDAIGQIAFGIKPTGELSGIFPVGDAAITTAKLEDGSVTRPKLSVDLEAVVPVELDSDQWLFLITDGDNKIGLSIDVEGVVSAKFYIPPSYLETHMLADGSVTRPKLGTDVEPFIPFEGISPEYLFYITDATDQIGFAIREDGKVIGNFEFPSGSIETGQLSDGAITEPKLADELSRRVFPNVGDVVLDRHDRLWRGKAVVIPQPSEVSGNGWARFQSFATPVLYGTNDTGTTLEFRRSSDLVVRGQKYIGTWAASGAPSATPAPGDFWRSTASGSFAGISWVTGDRIVALGEAYNGGSLGGKWTKLRAGEFVHLGEFTPASFSPSSTLDGDTYTADAAGTFSSITFATGDTLARIGGAWVKLPLTDYSSIANGASFHFRTQDAGDIEFRRADKSATQVYCKAYGYTTRNPKSNDDGILLLGDSLVSVGGLYTAFDDLITPRLFTPLSYSGASSSQIMTSFRDAIRNGGDPYRGRVSFFYHGTNNSGNDYETRRASLEFASLVGARDPRFAFLSRPGQRVMTWNGSRLVCPAHEDAFAGTGELYALEQWYRDTFPGQFISPRSEFITNTSGLTLPDLQFPGMTEAQVATTYGIIPLSYFFNFGFYSWTPAGLTFQGYWTSGSLPTGGTNGDYYLRTSGGGGFIGSLIVKWAGVWTEEIYDYTHIQPAGNAVLAQSMADFLTTHNL